MAKTPTDIKSLARSHTQTMINTLIGVAKNSENDGARVAAATHLLNRGWGMPMQETKVDGELRVTIRKMLGGENE
jgi:hypothetical protein